MVARAYDSHKESGNVVEVDGNVSIAPKGLTFSAKSGSQVCWLSISVSEREIMYMIAAFAIHQPEGVDFRRGLQARQDDLCYCCGGREQGTVMSFVQVERSGLRLTWACWYDADVAIAGDSSDAVHPESVHVIQ